METAPHLLLPYQRRWFRDKNPTRVVEKSRRVGFTWPVACEAVLDAAVSIGGCDVWYMSYEKQSTKQFINDVEYWVKALGKAISFAGEVLVNDEGEDILTYVVKFLSGHKITTLACRPAQLRGKQGHIILDEAAQYPDLNETLVATQANLMWRKPGYRVDVISTHFGVDNDFNKLVERIRRGELSYSLHQVTFDDAIEQGFYKRVCLMSGMQWSPEAEKAYRAEEFARYPEDWQAKQELMCVPARSGGQYLDRDLIERQTEPGIVLRWRLDSSFMNLDVEAQKKRVEDWCTSELLPHLTQLPKDLRHFFGEDFGRSSDLTVITIGHLTPLLQRMFTLAVELGNVPYECQKQILFYICDRLPRFVAGALDSNGNGNYLAEVAAQKYGATRVQKVVLNSSWYRDNMPPFKAALEARTATVIRDADHVADLCMFKILEGVPKIPDARNTGTDGHKRHGDAGVAYALGHFASRGSLVEFDYQAATKHPTPQARDVRTGQGFKAHRGGIL